MELHAVIVPGTVSHCSDWAVRCRACHRKTRRSICNRVTMAHPDGFLRGKAGKQSGFFPDVKRGQAVFLCFSGQDLTTHIMSHYLVPVRSEEYTSELQS